MTSPLPPVEPEPNSPGFIFRGVFPQCQGRFQTNRRRKAIEIVFDRAIGGVSLNTLRSLIPLPRTRYFYFRGADRLHRRYIQRMRNAGIFISRKVTMFPGRYENGEHRVCNRFEKFYPHRCQFKMPPAGSGDCLASLGARVSAWCGTL
jgi:hypothetical protein